MDDNSLDRIADVLQRYEEYQIAHEEYQIAQAKHDIKVAKVRGAIFFIGLIIMLALISIGSSIILNLYEANYNKEFFVGEFECPNCGSFDTEGGHLFLSNDGSLIKGTREYNLANADYTYFDCDYCGKDWKVYRKEWKALGY